MKKIISLLFLCFLVACSNSGDVNARVNDLIEYINARDFHNMWSLVSDKSKVKFAAQLEKNKQSSMGRKLISNTLNIAESDIDRLSTEDYFVAIFNTDKTAGVEKTSVTKIEEFNNTALLHWQKGNQQGTLMMVKENGIWYLNLDFVAGEN